MHRRYEHANIPIEILRTLVTISEQGNFAKAADKLRLSQPAITAQIKRLQMLLGGPVFERNAGGLAFTDLGRLVFEHARKILTANDQILMLGGVTSRDAPIRLGLSTLYAEALFAIWPQQKKHPQTQIYCDYSEELFRRVADGQLDVICCIEGPSAAGRLDTIESWSEPFVWVRSPTFFPRHGEPIPIVGRPGLLSEHPMFRALESVGQAYQIVFSSPDLHARLAAVSAGAGLFAMPKRFVPSSLAIATDIILPALPETKGAIYQRPGVFEPGVRWIIDCLKTLRPKKQAQTAH